MSQFPDAANPCHVCCGEGVINDHAFSHGQEVCPNCNGTGEEPLRLRNRKTKEKKPRTK
jgi:DnaJ-class molecular chaperone